MRIPIVLTEKRSTKNRHWLKVSILNEDSDRSNLGNGIGTNIATAVSILNEDSDRSNDHRHRGVAKQSKSQSSMRIPIVLTFADLPVKGGY